MSKALWRWMILGIALFAAGPLAGGMAGAVRGPDGGPGASALVSESPITGVALTLGAIAVATAVGLLGARLASVRSGLLAAGLTLAWAAWHSGRLDEVLRSAQSARPLRVLAVEAAGLGALGVVAAWLIERAGRKASGQSEARRPGFVDFAKAMALGIVAGGVASWAAARSEAVGQTVAATMAAGVFGGLVARLAAPGLPYAALIGAGFVLAVAGPVTASLIDGDQAIRRLYEGSIFALARPMPIDWLAGLFIGVPLGSSWAASMLEKKQHGPHQ